MVYSEIFYGKPSSELSNDEYCDNNMMMMMITMVIDIPCYASSHVCDLFYVQSSMSVVALLLVIYKKEFSPCLPAALCCDSNRLVFAFPPKTKAYRALFASVRLLLFCLSYIEPSVLWCCWLDLSRLIMASTPLVLGIWPNSWLLQTNSLVKKKRQ